MRFLMATLSALILSFVIAATVSWADQVENLADVSPGQTWDPEAEVPSVTVVGEQDDHYQRLAIEVRARLVEQMRYWRDRGLPNPPDLSGIYIFSSPGNISVRQIMAIMNPEIPDVVAHIHEQRQALEKSALLKFVVDFIEKIELSQTEDQPKKGAKSKVAAKILAKKDLVDKVVNMFFDYYCMIRYGYAVENTYTSIQNDTSVRDSKPSLVSPGRDNAFYGRFPRIDLADVLPSHNPETKSLGLEDVIKLSVMSERMRQNRGAFFSRRILTSAAEVPAACRVG